jgi:hypothetical protein
MAVNIPIWEGSSSFATGSTPYGFYDSDVDFTTEVDGAAKWAAQRLGYPINDVELQDIHFYAAFEEAVNEYGYWVNTYQSIDNLMNLQGATTSTNVSQKFVSPSLQSVFNLSTQYANAAGIGGTLVHYTGSISVKRGQQVYDLKSYDSMSLETGSFATDQFILRKVFHDRPPAQLRQYGGGVVDSGMGVSNVFDEFGFANTFGDQYLMMPLYYDALRMQSIELNDMIRRSSYSFALNGDRMRIFPIPTSDYEMHFHYTLNSDDIENITSVGGSEDTISDHSNMPYSNLTYSKINAVGRQWIRNFFLAICKETLGRIRGKYSEIPIPGREISLNYSDLLSEAESEKSELREQIKEILEEMSKSRQIERRLEEARNLSELLQFVPTKIYRG